MRLWLGVWLFGDCSGLAACGAEVEQDVGRQGGEGELLGLVDQDVVPAMCWPCFRVRGRLRVGRPVMWRSGRVRVAKVVKGSWVSRMMRIVALELCASDPPPRVISPWGLFGFVGRLPWSAGREAGWWLECRRSPCWTGPSGGSLSGDGSAGLLGSGCA